MALFYGKWPGTGTMPRSLRRGLIFAKRPKHGMVAQKWPRPRGRRNLQPITSQQAGVWDQVIGLIKRVDPEEFRIATNEAAGTALYTRDVLASAAFGNWISWPGYGPYPNGPASGPVLRPRNQRKQRAHAALLDPPRVNAAFTLANSWVGADYQIDVRLGFEAPPVMFVWDVDPGKIETPAKRKGTVRPHGKRLWFPNPPAVVPPVGGSGADWRFKLTPALLGNPKSPGRYAFGQLGSAPRVYFSTQAHERPNTAALINFMPVDHGSGQVGSGITGLPVGSPAASQTITCVFWGKRSDFYKMWQVPPPENEGQQPAIGFATFGDNDYLSWLYQDPTFGDPRRTLNLPGLSGPFETDWATVDADGPGDFGLACWIFDQRPGGAFGSVIRSAFVTASGSHQVTLDAFDNGPFPFNLTPWRIGGAPDTQRSFTGCLGDVWIKVGAALDPLSPITRNRFITSGQGDIAPRNLGDGTAGGLPTPNLYLRGATVSEYLAGRAPGATPWGCDYGALAVCDD